MAYGIRFISCIPFVSGQLMTRFTLAYPVFPHIHAYHSIHMVSVSLDLFTFFMFCFPFLQICFTLFGVAEAPNNMILHFVS